MTAPVELARLRGRLPIRSPADLANGVRIAEEEMVARVLAHPLSYPKLPSVSLLGPTGRESSLRSLILGQPTVLMVWDRRLETSDEFVAEVKRATELVESTGGQLLWITCEPDSYALQSFLRETGLPLAPHFDARSELARNLGHWETHDFYAVDGSGIVRARADSLMEAVRHLEVLRSGSRDTA